VTANLRFITHAELAIDCGCISVPNDVTRVFGIPRSGMLPATLLATRLHLPLGIVGGEAAFGGGDRMAEHEIRDGRTLLVDDSLWTGKSMEDAVRTLVRMGVPAKSIVMCAVYVAPETASHCDVYAHQVPSPRVFEWNLFHSWATHHLMLDMDGVVCMDPQVFDDDGALYVADIATAAAKYVPRSPVRAIATNRISRWRGVTTEWLDKHGAKYGTLHMRPEKTALERRTAGDPAAFKAALFKEDREAWLFVESHDAQAERIAGLAQKPVLSMESVSIFAGRN
jgi:uncharacterized HAD superfamily protein